MLRVPDAEDGVARVSEPFFSRCKGSTGSGLFIVQSTGEGQGDRGRPAMRRRGVSLQVLPLALCLPLRGRVGVGHPHN
jgi:hypothetical protein